MRLNGHEFDPWPPHDWSIVTWMEDSLQAGIPTQYVTSHPCQLSLLPSAGREMSTGQTAVKLCGWLIQTCGWQVKRCNPMFTRAMPERLTDELVIIKRYTLLLLT